MTKILVAAALAAALLLSGCEEDDDQTITRSPPVPAPATSGAALTPREFIRAADAVCLHARKRAAPVAKAISASVAEEDAAGVAAELRKGLPIVDQLLTGLRALRPPRGDERTIGAYLQLVTSQEERVRALIEALQAEDISTIEVLVAELREDNRRAERLADDYGFAQCGPGGFPSR